MQAASDEFYAIDPLNDINDWIWRFALFFTGTAYERRLSAALDLVKTRVRSGSFKLLMEHYGKHLVHDRSQRYFDILDAYFSAWGEFSQVHFSVGHGMAATGLATTSTNFPAVKMYYGNAFEAFAALVDLLTMLNNVMQGRDFDKLATITLKDYLALDKANRFNAFADVPELAALCEEHDNRLRNGSHHGDITYDSETSMVNYRHGKGEAAQVETLGSAEYLVKCSRMHHQIIVLLRFEMLLGQVHQVPRPV